MPRPTIKKCCRLVDMMGLLRDAWVTKEHMALLYGVSLRTIERDLEDIQAEPIYAGVVDDGKVPVRYHIISVREEYRHG